MKPTDRINKPIPMPDPAKGERETLRRTAQRNARGNVQLARGDFLTPKDKDLSNLKPL